MRKYRVLCLTDHTKHSKENSLYAFVKGFLSNARCEDIFVASRANPANHSFFQADDFSILHATKATPDFSFETRETNLLQATQMISPDDFDIIFLRLPRPVSDSFLRTLEQSFSTKHIVNKPSGIIECSNKSVLLKFEDVCPPIKLCHSIDEIIDFAQQFDIVLKPLKEYGGKGLLKIIGNELNDGVNNFATIPYLNKIESTIMEDGYLAMKYLHNVGQGDKRLLVAGGEILAASLRLPPEGSWLCNVAAGGKSIASKADPIEIDIVEKINPYLENCGILIYGVDTLVDDKGRRTLSEINALSIGGFPQAEKQTGLPIIQKTINKIINHTDQHYDQ